MSSTVMRVPLMQGFPIITAGSLEMRGLFIGSSVFIEDRNRGQILSHNLHDDKTAPAAPLHLALSRRQLHHRPHIGRRLDIRTHCTCRHCSLMFASVMTVFHISNSAFSVAAPSSRLVPRGSTPNLATAVLNSGFLSTLSLIAVLSLARMSAGTPAGANTPSQRSTVKPLMPASSTVGRSG